MKRQKNFGQLLKQYVEKTVEDTYAEYGHTGKARVNVVFQESITITLDTEDPYLDVKFWEFLGKVGEKLKETLKLAGYTYQGTNYYYSFCDITYKFTIFEPVKDSKGEIGK